MEELEYYQTIVKEKAHFVCLDLIKFNLSIEEMTQFSNPILNQQQYGEKIMESLCKKIALDLVIVENYLETNGLEDIKNMIGKFTIILETAYLSLYNKNVHHHKTQPTFITNHEYCEKCKESIQKSKINVLKKKVGITEVETEDTNFDNFGFEKFNGETDEFFDKQKHFFNDIDFQVGGIMEVLEKEVYSKTEKFLRRENDLMSRRVSIKKEGIVFEENSKEFNESLEYLQRFKSNFFNSIKVPIQETVIKIVSSLEKKKKSKNEIKSTAMQTIFTKETDEIESLEIRITQLKADIEKLSEIKNESEDNLGRMMEREKELRKEISLKNQEYLILEERYRTVNDNWRKSESRFQYHMEIKEKEITKLEKNISDLNKTQEKEQIGSSYKFSNLSVPMSEKPRSRRPSRKEKENKNYRPSLDYNIHILETETNPLRNKKNERKNMSLLRPTNQNHNELVNFDVNNILMNKSKSNISELSYQESHADLKEENRSKGQRFESEQKVSTTHLTQLSRLKIETDCKIECESENKEKMHEIGECHEKNEKIPRLLKVLKNNVVDKKEILSKTFDDQKPRTSILMKSFAENKKEDGFVFEEKPKRPSYLSTRVKTEERYHRQHEKGEPIYNQLGRSTRQSDRALEKLKKITHQIKDKDKAKEKSKFEENENERENIKEKEKKSDNEKENENHKGKKEKENKLFKDRVLKSQPNESRFKELNNFEIKEENLDIFGDEKSIIDYQENQGLWATLDTKGKLILDLENANFTRKIESYFKFLEDSNIDKYEECLNFLISPLKYIESRKNKECMETKKIENYQIQRIFTKLLRFHKIKHRRCEHVQQFLNFIGFYEN